MYVNVLTLFLYLDAVLDFFSLEKHFEQKNENSAVP